MAGSLIGAGAIGPPTVVVDALVVVVWLGEGFVIGAVAGVVVVVVVVDFEPAGIDISPPYQSFTPLCPRHAPFFSALEE